MVFLVPILNGDRRPRVKDGNDRGGDHPGRYRTGDFCVIFCSLSSLRTLGFYSFTLMACVLATSTLETGSSHRLAQSRKFSGFVQGETLTNLHARHSMTHHCPYLACRGVKNPEPLSLALPKLSSCHSKPPLQKLFRRRAIASCTT